MKLRAIGFAGSCRGGRVNSSSEPTSFTATLSCRVSRCSPCQLIDHAQFNCPLIVNIQRATCCESFAVDQEHRHHRHRRRQQVMLLMLV